MFFRTFNMPLCPLPNSNGLQPNNDVGAAIDEPFQLMWQIPCRMSLAGGTQCDSPVDCEAR